MEWITAGLPLWAFWAAVSVTVVAGFVKGVVGFAMPMIMISGLSSFMSPELALAGLVVPTLVTNISQAFRQGIGPAAATAWTYRRFLIAMVVGIAVSAPFIQIFPLHVLFLALGLPILAYALAQLAGISLVLRLEHQRGAEWTLGAVGGLYGGFSGVWGPPMLVYLMSTGTPKAESMRALGVAFLIGASMLLIAHFQTGVLNAQTLAFSAALTIPAQIGMQIGYWAHDRLDQSRFRWWTLVVLALMALNLIRRGFM